ncbi:MAG: hypothetical protein J0G32_02885 [Alphaproteobacteria bacterium]|nr:hypothetical protein [Alphaproteobacteria bacterium]OJV15327.1 MAG: hypothetical protein BGO27_02330 [Alphaproteobacteria bacterium 33-17]
MTQIIITKQNAEKSYKLASDLLEALKNQDYSRYYQIYTNNQEYFESEYTLECKVLEKYDNNYAQLSTIAQNEINMYNTITPKYIETFELLVNIGHQHLIDLSEINTFYL